GIRRHDVVTALHRQGAHRLADVERATLSPSGSIVFDVYEQARPVTVGQWRAAHDELLAEMRALGADHGRPISTHAAPGPVLAGGGCCYQVSGPADHRPSSACSTSPIRSPTSSMPTDIRTRFAGTSSCEPAVEAWVIAPGCSISDSTPPSDSARVNKVVRAQKSSAACSPPASSTEIMPPNRRICLAAAAWVGCDSRPG